MDAWLAAFTKIYELTAFLYFAIFAVIVTIYAILASYLGKFFKQTKEDYERLKSEAEIGIPQGGGDILASSIAWRQKIAESQEKLERWTNRFKSHTIRCTLIYPSSLTLSGVLAIFFAIVLINLNWLSWAFVLSLVVYLVSILLVYLGLSQFVIPRLREVEEIARESSESPIESVQKILREQAAQSSKQYQVTYEKLISELKNVVDGLDRLYELKEPKFTVRYVVGSTLCDIIEITKGKEEEITIRVDNNSEFPVLSTLFEGILPESFTLIEKGKTAMRRPADLDPYPRGAKHQEMLGDMGSNYIQHVKVLITGKEVGVFMMIIWLVSTSHKRGSYKLKVKVKDN
jgi:hypothetical protein